MRKLLLSAAIFLCCGLMSSVNGQSGYPSLNFGGELRARARSFDGINFGDVEEGNDFDTYINLKGLIYGDLQINKNIGLYSQITSAHTLFKDEISANDKDLLAVDELYADFTFYTLPLNVRVGRQSISLGSGRLVGTSDGPNVAKKFDGLRTGFSAGSFSGDLVFASLVEFNEGAFDNKISGDKLAYGGFFSLRAENNRTIDLYLFGNRLANMAYLEERADENRYSLGGRIIKTGTFGYEAEAIFQRGRFGDHPIRAYQLTANISYKWTELPMTPSVKLSGSLFSGRQDSTDSRMHVFRPVYSRPPVYVTVPIGPSNIILFVPEGRVDFTNNLNLTLRYYAVWRHYFTDGLYNNQVSEMNRGRDCVDDEKGRFVTNGLVATLNYNITANFTASLTASSFSAGEYMCSTGLGKNSKAAFLNLSYTF